MTGSLKLPAEGTLLRAVYDALEAGPADAHTINQRLPRAHRCICANALSKYLYKLCKRGVIKGRKPKGHMKMYARLADSFPALDGFTSERRARAAHWQGRGGRRR
tara:strand:- start:567 stop:881 length:315 start_codon:yes stop_codon:yes gene_type:complete